MRKRSNVLSLRGGPTAGGVQPGVIRKLEELLSEAKRGHIQGLAYSAISTVPNNPEPRHGWVGAMVYADLLRLTGSIDFVKADIQTYIAGIIARAQKE